MTQFHRTLIFLAIASVAYLSPLSAQAKDPIAISKILDELQMLRDKVTELEARLERIEERKSTPIPAETTEKQKNWIQALRTDLRKAEIEATEGGWTRPETWEGLSLDMPEDEALELLGEPARSKFSIRKDTDLIHIYRGDIDGSGREIEGEVRIYKGKVTDILVPEF